MQRLVSGRIVDAVLSRVSHCCSGAGQQAMTEQRGRRGSC